MIAKETAPKAYAALNQVCLAALERTETPTVEDDTFPGDRP